MTAIKLMQSILASADAKPRIALLGRLLYPLLATEDTANREIWSEQILFPVSDGGVDGSAVLKAAFSIADHSLVSVVMKANVAGELQIQPCGLVDDAGDHDALVMLIHERPVMTIWASDDNTFAVRIGGFENSGVVHDGNLAELSRDAASANIENQPLADRRDRRRNTATAARAFEGKKRRALTRLRNASEAPALNVPLPRLVIRMIGRQGDAARDAVQAVLHRDAPPRMDENGLLKSGPAQIGLLATHVKAALGVHVLQTAHALKSLGFTKRGADGKIAQELEGGELDISPLMALGRANLPSWTGFDSEEELAHSSGAKYQILEHLRLPTPMPDRDSRARAELANVKPLSLTYARAKNVLKAFDRSRKSSQNLARVEIGAAYAGIGANFLTRNLIEIAMTGDINPIPLWPSHGEVSAGTFEVLRFIGRLQRGTTAVLLPMHFGILRQALALEPEERTMSEAVIAGILGGFFKGKVIAEALDLVEACGDALVVARRTRELGVGEAVPRLAASPRQPADI